MFSRNRWPSTKFRWRKRCASTWRCISWPSSCWPPFGRATKSCTNRCWSGVCWGRGVAGWKQKHKNLGLIDKCHKFNGKWQMSPKTFLVELLADTVLCCTIPKCFSYHLLMCVFQEWIQQPFCAKSHLVQDGDGSFVEVLSTTTDYKQLHLDSFGLRWIKTI